MRRTELMDLAAFDPVAVDLLGHSHVAMTTRYAHLADDALSAAADKVGELLLKQAGMTELSQQASVTKSG